MRGISNWPIRSQRCSSLYIVSVFFNVTLFKKIVTLFTLVTGILFLSFISDKSHFFKYFVSDSGPDK